MFELQELEIIRNLIGSTNVKLVSEEAQILGNLYKKVSNEIVNLTMNKNINKLNPTAEPDNKTPAIKLESDYE